ncbi:class A beta-lactamase [Pantoea allii]|uniref:beta-lactamase n=1 Tax=Pantoea allii TaxID=574096 RepID=A0ABS6VAB0_9GAMM|nr:class A beta-lactamase [Pantoea allii]MBW1212120.1 class A beta-lactamase [Pantoea allii]MBW1256242.1 class A beta-lactamase [Pantoea allii]MBW1265319.1 class A beta-lactamase [Pantoea allii]MBW1287436.1 class A beta-lactamase [Pantoea allii]
MINLFTQRARPAVILLALATPLAAQASFDDAALQRDIQQLEQTAGGRLGVAVTDTADGTVFTYRGNTRFPLCSTSKVFAVAAILKKSETASGLLNENVAIHKTDLVNYNPITEKHVGATMTVAELSAAALQYSDNAAMNKLLTRLGGPQKVTRFARSIGDTTFRLDRKEPDLNSAIPGDKRDTTSPAAMMQSLQKLVLGSALAPAQRQQLSDWMKGNTTGANSLRAGLPADWTVADKTGSGDYGTTNDIAVIWPPHHAPLVLVTYYTQPDPHAASRKAVLAGAAKIIASGYSQ